MLIVIIGAAIVLPFVFIPLGQAIDYHRDCQKYGKTIADKLRARF